MERLNSGELKTVSINMSSIALIGLTTGGRKNMAGGGGNKKRYQYCTDSSGIILYLRALQGHSGRSLIDPTLQDNVVIPSNFFQYIYHVGCTVKLHSIINSGLILGGQNLNNRQYSFCLWIPWTKTIRILIRSTWMHRVMHNTCIKHGRRHQNTVYWVDINLAFRKGLKFYQTRSNAIILHETLPAYCIPKLVRMETGEVIYEKVYASPRPPPKISLEHDWKRELGSEDAQTTRGTSCQHFKSSQSSQPIPNPSRDRSGQLVVRTDRSGQPVVGADTRTVQDGRKTSRSQVIDVNSIHEETVSSDTSVQPVVETSKTHTRSSGDSKSLNVELAHDRSGQPVVETNTENVPDGSQTRSSHESTSFNVGDETIRDRTEQPVVNHDESSHEQTMLNEVNMDFRIPGLPHSVVKQAESSRVRELVKKIERHPDRHALQLDPQQNQAYNPFSPESRRMIQDVDNEELFELLETDPKTQCKACLSYWSEGIVNWTCGHLFTETVANRRFIVYTLDILSIPEKCNQEGKTSWPQIWESSRKQG